MRQGFSLFEMVVATGLLLLVVGPLLYIMHTGTLMGMGDTSAALLSCHIAAERIQSDLDQMTFPDGPDQANGTRMPAFVITEPGPEMGSKITFWIPRVRSATDVPPRQVKVVPVSYYLEPIQNSEGRQTATGRLVREVGATSGSGGPQKSYVGAVILRRLMFHLLRNLEEDRASEPPAGGGDMAPFGGAAMSADVLRVHITAADRPAMEEQMNDEGTGEDRTRAAGQVKTFTLGFLKAVAEPSTVWRLRDPAANEEFKFIATEGTFPGSP